MKWAQVSNYTIRLFHNISNVIEVSHKIERNEQGFFFLLCTYKKLRSIFKYLNVSFMSLLLSIIIVIIYYESKKFYKS